MTGTRVAYDSGAALGKVRWWGLHLFGWQVNGLRRRYMRSKNRPLLSGWLLAGAEKRAWKVANRSRRLTDSSKRTLTELAQVSNAARNAGLAVLVRDLIPQRFFARLTRPWRAMFLPLPKAPKRQVAERITKKRKVTRR